MGDPVFSHVRYSQIALLLQFCDFRCVPSLVFELSECLAFDYRSNQHSDESSSSGKIAPETMSGRIENRGTWMLVAKITDGGEKLISSSNLARIRAKRYSPTLSQKRPFHCARPARQ